VGDRHPAERDVYLNNCRAHFMIPHDFSEQEIDP